MRSAILGRDITIALLWICSLALWGTLEALRVDAPLTLDLRGVPDVAAVVAAVARHRLAARTPHQDFVPAHTLWLVSGYLPAVVAGCWALGATCRKRRS